MITDELLNELEQKEKAATPAPWSYDAYDVDERESCGLGFDIVGPPEAMLRGQLEHKSDASLIAAARDALPDLLAEVRKLRAENAALREAVRPLVEAYNNDTGVTNGLLWASEYLDASTYRSLLAARAAADALEGLLDA